MEDISRRRLLRNGSAGLITAGTVGLAGCTGSVPIIGDDDYDGATVTNWLSKPAFDDVFDEDEAEDNDQIESFSLEDDETVGLSFEYVLPDVVFDNEQNLNGLGLLNLGSGLRSRIGVPATETDWALSQETGYTYEFSFEDNWGGEGEAEDDFQLGIEIVAGAFDPDDVEYNLGEWVDEQDDGRDDVDYDLSNEGEYEGYDLYLVDEADLAYAVDHNHVIEVSGDEMVDEVEAVEAVLDTRWNAEGRWRDEPDFEAFFQRYGSKHYCYAEIETEPFYDDDELDSLEAEDWLEGIMGFVQSYEIDGETSELTQLLAYENERDASADDVREAVETSRDIGDEWETLQDYSVTENGPIVSVGGTVRTSTI